MRLFGGLRALFYRLDRHGDRFGVLGPAGRAA